MPERSAFHNRPAVLLFLLLWGLYGAVTNLWDQYGYNLMHAGVEALAERGKFSLEGSPTPRFARMETATAGPGRDSSTDTFRRGERLYAMKHPGMFFTGAIVYKPLSLVGVRYSREYNITTALVSWFSSGLLGALLVSLFFTQCQREGLSLHTSLAAALSLGIGSLFFPYSGILHHDFLAACFLYFSYYLCIHTKRKEGEVFSSLAGGFLAGYAFTCSPLALLFFLPFAAGVAWKKGWRALRFFLIGYIPGLAPLLVYNAACFGNPFLLPNAAGRVTDTGLIFSLSLFLEKFSWYFLHPRSAVWSFFPVFYFALAGLVTRAVRREKDSIALLGGTGLLLLYIHAIETYGGAMYGPRYLVPCLPLVFVGLIPVMKEMTPYRKVEGINARTGLWFLFGAAFCMSVTICFAGAIRGTMYGMAGHPFWHRLKLGMGLSGMNGTPGAFPLLYPLVALASAAFYFGNTRRPAAATEEGSLSTSLRTGGKR